MNDSANATGITTALARFKPSPAENAVSLQAEIEVLCP